MQIDSKDVLLSSRNNRSILFSLYLSRMSKKMDYFLRNLVRREWFQSNFLHSSEWCSIKKWASSLLCGFAFAFDRYAKSFTFSCNACSSSWSSDISVSVVVRIHHKFICSMINSDPRVSVVFAQRPNSNLNSVFAIRATGRHFQHRSNFCVSLDPSSWLWWSIFFEKSVFTTIH